MTAGMMLTFIPTTSMAATKGWNGNDKDGWRYYTTSSSYVKNNWKQIGGKWYYFDSKGLMESNCYRDGYWLTKSGAWDTRYSNGTWKQDSKGWWYTDNGWYPKNQWLWIDGNCYFFDASGYMESNCYRDGCWLTKSGAWDQAHRNGTWKKDSTGWWYTDNGWYPKNQWLKIDGTKYWFDANGYWNPSGETKPVVKVTDAVNKQYSLNIGTSKSSYYVSYDFIVPQVSISGKDMSAVNNQIYDACTARKYTNNQPHPVSYKSYVDDDVVSIIITIDNGELGSYEKIDYNTFNISVKTGKLISSSELVKMRGLTDSQFFDSVEAAYDDFWNKQTQNLKVSDSLRQWYQTNYDNISYEHLSPFISPKGDLCCVSNEMHIIGGSGIYDEIINTSIEEVTRL